MTQFLTSSERPRIWRYSHSAGPVRSKFLLHLRDDRKIMGTRCPSCQKVFVPARPTCHACFADMTEWVPVSDEGTVESYTVTSGEEPAAFGIIKLDGADTGIVHKLGGMKLEEIRAGTRVKAVFAAERRGDIRDIEYFTSTLR